ncbi:DUF2231 domain-containing protein [Flavobacterium sp.]|uniref:DUF2231 domain-containing protein n=1 Tax=Flavobacterium sp. TaxID=239 RepID=UPI003D14539E
MNELPSLWRTELWHPLMVHLPIVTLLLATAAGLLQFVVKSTAHALFLKQITFVMLVLGVLGGWLAIYTGQLAYNIEVRKICDPQPLQSHQWWSYVSVIIFTLTLCIQLTQKYLNQGLVNYLRVITAILLLMGGCALLYTGHLGASVVYQQGAGTYKPSADCHEFEK